MFDQMLHSPSARRAWLVCLGCSISLFTVMGLGSNCFSVYQPYLLELEGFTNSQASWVTTIRSLFGMLSIATADTLCRRIGLRWTTVLGMGSFVCSYFLFGAVHSFPLYCAAAVLSGLAYGYGGMVPLTLVISHWFHARRGLALGIMAAGSGIATIVAPPLLTQVIETFGLRFSYWGEGLVALLLTAAVLVLVRDKPADLGMEAYSQGELEGPVPVEGDSAPPAHLPKKLWWMAVAAAFFTGGPCGPGFSHLTVLYRVEGYDSGTVALLVSCFGLALMIAKIIYGVLSDTLGSYTANLFIYGTGVLGLCLCCLAPIHSLPLAAAAFIITALGMPLSNVCLSVWAGVLTSQDDYDRLVKWLSTAYMLGSLVTGPLPGVLADLSGSYVPAYVLFVLSLICSMVLIQGVYRRLGLVHGDHRPS